MRTDKSRLVAVAAVAVVVALFCSGPAMAGFAGKDLFVPFVGRGVGVYPSNWFTTAYIYNPNAMTVTVNVYFLERNKNNVTTAPPMLPYTLNAGETRMIENIVEAEFGKQAYGALRITCDQDVVVGTRTFSKESASAPLDQSFGQDFAGIPASFAIALNETTEILGGFQTFPIDSSQQRTNFGCVETLGKSATVRFSARDAAGVEKDFYDKAILPLSQVQGAYKDYFDNIPALSLTNARISAKVISGQGAVICYGSVITNDATKPKPVQDPTTWEMQYPAKALTTPHTAGLFHGVVWSTDGLVIEGGVELELSDLGVVTYSGSGGLQCGDALYTLDFADTPASPLAIDADGDFTGSVVIAYEDGGATVFTTTWTLTGNIDENGIVTGILATTTTGGTGGWASCNGANIQRDFRAGWTENP